LAKLKTQ
jgi:hypothetical protein